MNTLFKDRWLTGTAILGLLIILVNVLFNINAIYFLVGPMTVTWVYDLSLVVSAFAGALLSFLLWRSFGQGEVLKTIWGAMALGLFLWGLGEATTAVYDLILQEEIPYPSVADIPWVLGYIPLFIALYLRYRSLRTTPTRTQTLTTLAVFLVLAILAVIFVIGPIVLDTEYYGVEDRLEQFLDALYPLGDLAIVLGAMLTVLVLFGGDLSWPWLVIGVGFLVVSFADLLYSYGTWTELYLTDPAEGTNLLSFFMDVLYLASYVIIAYGLMMQSRLQKAI